MTNDRLKIVVPGDHPPMIAGSPHLERLAQFGDVVLFDTLPKDENEQFERVKDADIIINSRGQVKWPEALLRRLPQLKLISLCSIGTDCVELETARELDVTVCNVPGRTSKVVAEHAFALMFAVARRMAFTTNDLKRGGWTSLLSVSLIGKTLGVLGTGNIGCELIQMAKAFGMNVVAWTYNPDRAKAESMGFEYRKFDDVLKVSDVVSVNVKLTDDSRGLVGADQLALMKPGSLLINTARAAVVDTDALIAALSSGHLMGAGLDVYDLEPVPANSPILQCDHVVLTPHAADQLPEAIDALNDGAVDNVIAYLEGHPKNVVN